MVVVHRVEVTVDAEKGVGDGGPVTGQLSVVLVVEHPRRDARAHDQPGSSLEEEVAPGDPGRARWTSVAQDVADRPSSRPTASITIRRRLGDSLAVWTLLCPGSSSCRMLRRAPSTSPGSRSTTASSMTPARSLSSLKAHMHTTVEATSDRHSMNSLRARIAHAAPDRLLIHSPRNDKNPGHAWVFRSGDDGTRTHDPLLAK